MVQLGFVVPTGVMVLVAFLYLRRLEDSRTASNWAWGWIALYVAGLALSLEQTWPILMVVSTMGLSLFAGFVLAGALAFAGQEKGWVVPLAAGFGLLRSGILLAGHPGAADMLALPMVVPMSAGAAVVVWRATATQRVTAPDRLLAPVLAVNAALTAAAPILNFLGRDSLPLVVIWANVAVLLVFLQLMALEERRRRTQDQLHAETARQARSLEQEQGTLRALLDAVPAGILLLDDESYVTAMNGIGVEHYGLGNSTEWIGRHGDDVFEALGGRLAEESVERLGALIDRTDREIGWGVNGAEMHLIRPVERIVVIYSRPVISLQNADQRIGEVWISWDVTEQRELAERVQHASRMEMLGTLAGGVAHDFNNQLTPILGNAQFLADSLPDDDELQDATRDLRRAAEHCAELTRDLLAVAKRTPTRPCPVDSAKVIDEVVSLLRANLPASIELHVDVAAGTLPLHADPTQLQRVLTNLLVNARDAVAGEGRIDVRVRNAAASGPEPGQRWVEIEIEDTGVGMDRETRDHVFDPFFTTKSVGKGTGLGLSIVYGIVETHDASIDVDSQPGRGTCFRLRWPAEESALPAREEEQPAPAPTEGHETILLAEDEPGVRRMARRALEMRGYRVLEAEDGDAALERYGERVAEIDLALLDFTMPGRDGARTLEALRERDPALLAILMSGHLDRDGLGGPSVDASFLAKPFTPEQLATAVREVLDA